MVTHPVVAATSNTVWNFTSQSQVRPDSADSIWSLPILAWHMEMACHIGCALS